MLLSYTKADGHAVKMRLKAVPHSPTVTLGRGKEATITIEDGHCSRIHCAIMFWDDIFVIRDKGSSNGTLVNGAKIEVSKLKSGDVIKIGDTEITATSEASTSDLEATMRG